VGRVALTIACLVIGLLAVGAYFSAVADDPCNDQHRSAPAVALFIGAVVFGVAAYFLAERRTSRRWIPMMVLVATSVGVYFALATIALLVYWIPQCAN
jgi:O-antigen/teichoic acid export membrane protein